MEEKMKLIKYMLLEFSNAPSGGASQEFVGQVWKAEASRKDGDFRHV